MKKLILSLSLVTVFALTASAQEFGFKKSDFMVEGSFKSTNSENKNTESKTSNFGFTPKAGYFVTDKIAVGVELGFGQEKENFLDNQAKTAIKVTQFSAGAFVRYYFLEVGSRFKTYAEVGGGYDEIGFDKSVSGMQEDNLKSKGFGINGSVGANYFLTKNVAINFAFADVIAYNSSKLDSNGAKSVSEFSTNVNVFDNFFNSANFGLSFKF